MKELSVYPVIYDQKVAWGDMDAFGHVNNVQYYRYIRPLAKVVIASSSDLPVQRLS